jgi:hypothetical protein
MTKPGGEDKIALYLFAELARRGDSMDRPRTAAPAPQHDHLVLVRSRLAELERAFAPSAR